MSESTVMIGIDVASDHVDVAALGAPLPAGLARVSNDVQGHTRLADALVELRPGLVLMEATGGYEVRLLTAMLQAQCLQRVQILALIYLWELVELQKELSLPAP